MSSALQAHFPLHGPPAPYIFVLSFMRTNSDCTSSISAAPVKQLGLAEVMEGAVLVTVLPALLLQSADTSLPKRMLFRVLSGEEIIRRRKEMIQGDVLKASLRKCTIPADHWESPSHDCSQWSRSIWDGTENSEIERAERQHNWLKPGFTSRPIHPVSHLLLRLRKSL